MKIGASLILIRGDIKGDKTGYYVAGNRYIVREFGTVSTYSWVAIDGPDGDLWEFDIKDFKPIHDVRQEALELLGI